MPPLWCDPRGVNCLSMHARRTKEDLSVLLPPRYLSPIIAGRINDFRGRKCQEIRAITADYDHFWLAVVLVLPFKEALLGKIQDWTGH